MHEIINDAVDVEVTFSSNHVAPRRMRWNERNYEIRTVNLVHSAMEGMKRVFYFSVSDLTNYFKLRLDTDLLEWRLVEIYSDG
ncbi:MAG: hypothetical protein UY77_C0001G0007 [Candidatus Uhrbacteria bacterium GW2011_GWA2_53_10]|uniref:Uncharacterized protein n=1 Tax=Candidatus Uhrbacteria bacterium GW2011_GWA2_53_10 TaxID=1618980 RepID=A0A0G1ZY08_9BACT|nr:MAG: hypothetical protein UY77_C0001G0007 [Candidatus Uhrbacteria bacterium GW2011_GWA2_53_10]